MPLWKGVLIIQKNCSTWTVYKHTSPSGKVYIGITSQTPEKRWLNGKGYSANEYFSRAICKYGWNNFKHEILVAGLAKEEAEAMEIELIAQYDSTNRAKGYNLSLGGGINYPSEEGRQRLRQMWLGHKHSDEVRQKISKTQKGRIIPPEVRKKMSESHKGLKRTEEHLRNNRLAKLKPVMCIETGERFESMLEAQEKYHTRHIHSVCKGHRKTAGGYHWRYVERGDVDHGGRKAV